MRQTLRIGIDGHTVDIDLEWSGSVEIVAAEEYGQITIDLIGDPTYHGANFEIKEK